MRHLLAMCFLGALSLTMGEAQAATCELQVDEQMGVYIIALDGAPFKNKRYLTYQDAVKLRDVLISSGTCRHPKNLRKCGVVELGVGKYAITWGGMTFDKYTSYASREMASRDIVKLTKKRICVSD